jgi:hypothetical protein
MVSKHPIYQSSQHNQSYLLPAVLGFYVKVLQHLVHSSQIQCYAANVPSRAIFYCICFGASINFG